jgi:BirA family biotin operon repressor/biotin-[acetyl-CoA-carboxylase] ligase
VIGSRVIRLGAVDSTNDAAARLAAEGALEGTAVVAAEQLAGRGRQGRPWHSPVGDNIYCSVILRPPRPVREWPDLSWTLAAGVASCARACGAGGAVVKYPNDVLVEGRKLAGLLLESRTGSGGQAALVAGIGVNVNTGAEAFPAALLSSATSLAILTGQRLDCDAVLGRLFSELDAWYALWVREGAAGALRRLEAEGFGTAAGFAAASVPVEAPAGSGV